MSLKPRVLLSWSSGKDSAWTLHQLRQRDDLEVVALVTTMNESADRVAMHAVRRTLVDRQAKAVGLPLWTVPLPWPCSNLEYESRMRSLIQRALHADISFFAFGDLFLSDIRAYREKQLAGSGITPLFPLWDQPTAELAQEMVSQGLRAVLTCVDSAQLDTRFLGRTLNRSFLAELPASVDPCGERGEFHTFCYAGPMFAHSIPITLGPMVQHDRFCFIDVLEKEDSVHSFECGLADP